jgi:YspA, cpYpsA-related SLOG family
MNRYIIAGGRDFDNYSLLKKTCDEHIVDKSNVEVVCGMARGADLLGKRWADENNVSVVKFPADWNKHGKSAGYIRNAEMGEYGTHLIAFWDGISKGTKHMINMAKKKNLQVIVVMYKNE